MSIIYLASITFKSLNYDNRNCSSLMIFSPSEHFIDSVNLMIVQYSDYLYYL